MKLPAVPAALLAAVLLAPAAPLPAQATPAASLPASSNTALTGAIMQRLTNDPVLGNITITAKVGDGGAVSLNGVVPTQALVDRAVALVKTVPGVTQVVSQILVNVDPFSPPHPLPAVLPPINATLAPPPAANEPQALIADALAKVPALSQVSVQVYGNEVMLLGTVATDQDSQRAVQLARQILPQAPIVNILWVEPRPLSSAPLIPKS
ncbi:MAG TPA: BON domain-containing protein [Terriglobales bacterium]|nr:BON domain-containing protein [Terriglobales bacterium]